MSTPLLALKQLQELLDTAVAVARSEVGVMNMRAATNVPYEPWPEMDELVKLLDRLTPGWQVPA